MVEPAHASCTRLSAGLRNTDRSAALESARRRPAELTRAAHRAGTADTRASSPMQDAAAGRNLPSVDRLGRNPRALPSSEHMADEELPEERLAALLALLPPAPEAWVEAAKQLPGRRGLRSRPSWPVPKRMRAIARGSWRTSRPPSRRMASNRRRHCSASSRAGSPTRTRSRRPPPAVPRGRPRQRRPTRRRAASPCR